MHHKSSHTASSPSAGVRCCRARPDAHGAPARPPGRAADGDPRHHSREYRAAEPREGSAAQRITDQLDDHELLPRFRKPPAFRRPCRRPPRAPPPVPDRAWRLHCLFPRLCPCRNRRNALRSASRSGSWGSDALSRGFVDHHELLPWACESEGARRLGRSRRRGRSDRRSGRRSSDRVRRLEDDLLRQSPGRGRPRDHGGEGHPDRQREAALARARSAGCGPCNHEPRLDRLRDHPGFKCGLDFLSDARLRSCRSRRSRRVRCPRIPHREAAAQGWAARRSRSRRRPLPDACGSRIDLRALLSLLGLSPERPWNEPADDRPRLRSARARSRGRRSWSRPHRRSPWRSRTTRLALLRLQPSAWRCLPTLARTAPISATSSRECSSPGSVSASQWSRSRSRSSPALARASRA